MTLKKNKKLLKILKKYPCFNDEIVSEIEAEIEAEYLKDCASDLFRCYDETTREVLELLGIDEIDFEIYREACDKTNTYFVVEAGGNGYIDFERIAPSYLEILKAQRPEIDKLITLQETINNRPTFPLDFYDGAEDMLYHREGKEITQDEAFDVLRYCAELEKLIQEIQ